MDQPLTIPLSKSKMLFGIGSCLMLIAMGCFVVQRAETNDAALPPMLMKVIGIACVIFFSIALVLGIKRMLRKDVGLKLDEKGITDQSTATAIGFIPWKDITGFKAVKIFSSRFIVVFVYAPDQYLDRYSGMRQKALTGNMKRYGSPVIINVTTLDYNFKQLMQLLNGRLSASRAATAPRR